MSSRRPAVDDISLTEIAAFARARELLLTDEVRRPRAAALAEQHRELIEMLDKITQGHPVDGMEALSPAVRRRHGAADRSAANQRPCPDLRPRVGARPGNRLRRAPARSSPRGRPPAGGGKAPIDLGASAYQPLADFSCCGPWPEEWLGRRCHHQRPVRSTILRLAPSDRLRAASSTEYEFIRTEDGEIIGCRTNQQPRGEIANGARPGR